MFALCSVGTLNATQVQDGDPPRAGARVERLVEGLEYPWSLAFLPGDEGVLITERPGRLRRWTAEGLSEPIAGVPDVFARGQGGLLDVALAPDFASSRRV
ncbi:MAG TPA: PQQ-dependent sugar dehydrogenase, partial [Burkholderiaceae bacterium]|nr:PQQ-dependent sugar dehydrogenase [Burkholderiaceae bacterium]